MKLSVELWLARNRPIAETGGEVSDCRFSRDARCKIKPPRGVAAQVKIEGKHFTKHIQVSSIVMKRKTCTNIEGRVL
jgi:hypothetical protein